MRRLVLAFVLLAGCAPSVGGGREATVATLAPASGDHVASADAVTHLTVTTSARRARPRPSRSRPASAPRLLADTSGAMPVVQGDVWAALARCESGMRHDAVGGGGRYFSFFQWTLSTAHSVGLAGDPRSHSYDEQVAAAQRLQARSGWGQWPVCSRRLGLR